jgi:hypothetical protein
MQCPQLGYYPEIKVYTEGMNIEQQAILPFWEVGKII